MWTPPSAHLTHFMPALLPARPRTQVRHPSDAVIERLTSKPVKGVTPYPECSPTTIGECADSLCGATAALLDSLAPARAAGRLKLLKWEAIARRRVKVSAELREWLGLDAANSTALLQRFAERVEAQTKAYNQLAKDAPISLQSLKLVEQRCAALMARLSFRPTANIAPSASGSTKARRHAARSGKRGGAEAAPAEREPLLLLRRSKASGEAKAPIAWCPLRLTGVEAISRLFVSLDAPKAAKAPSCFPNAKGDVCPVPSKAAWQSRRWGAYPFAVVEPELGEAGGAGGAGGERSTGAWASRLRPMTLGGATPFSFSVVRNPWDRLASAYSKLIAVEERGTAVHRAWIREMHLLGEKQPISFSHFARWVVAQEPAATHRAWKPYSHSCRFDQVRYSFVGRFESLRDDVGRLLGRMLDAGVIAGAERWRKAWLRANYDTQPTLHAAHPDRLLKLHHLYFSDDRHDLVEIVRAYYREDIERFGYEFPRNTTLMPWEA